MPQGSSSVHTGQGDITVSLNCHDSLDGHLHVYIPWQNQDAEGNSPESQSSDEKSRWYMVHKYHPESDNR